MRSTLEHNRTFSQLHHKARSTRLTHVLAGTYVLSRESPNVQCLDPNGAARTVFLPAYVLYGSSLISIANTGTVGNLDIVDANGVSIGTVSPGSTVGFLEDTATWRVLLDARALLGPSFDYFQSTNLSVPGNYDEAITVSQIIGGGTFGVTPYTYGNSWHIVDGTPVLFDGIDIYYQTSVGWAAPKNAVNINAVLGSDFVDHTTNNALVGLAVNTRGVAPIAGGAARGDNITLFSLNPWVWNDAGSGPYFAIVGAEFDLGIATGTSVKQRIGIQVQSAGPQNPAAPDLGLRGTERDVAYLLGAGIHASGSGITWGTGWSWYPGSFDNTSYIMKGGITDALGGIDLTDVTFTGNAFSSPGFTVGALGNVATRRFISDNNSSNALLVGIGPPANLGWPYAATGAYNYNHVTVPGSHVGALYFNTVFAVNTPGSTSFGPTSADGAIGASVLKDNYLTSIVEGELDVIYTAVYQGRKGDAGLFLGGAVKVKSGTGADTGGVLGFEISAQWVNPSGTILNDVHSIAPFLEGASGVSGGIGYGFYTESFTATNYAGVYVGNNLANDPNAKWTYAFVAANARTLAGQYFRVVGDAVTGAGVAGDIIMGVNGATKTIRNLAGVLQVRNAADNATLFQISDTGAVGVASEFTLAAGTTAKASLNIPVGAAPTSPVDGDIWREDNTNTGLKVRINGVTKTITVS